VCYPSVSQYEQWKEQSEQMGYNSVSQFMTEMVEAGYKQLGEAIIYDQETAKLRQQRNELKRELDESRERVTRLEEKLYQSERRSIIRFLKQQDNGATFAEIVQHLIDDTPARAAEVLDETEFARIEATDDHYHLKEDKDDDNQ
jgi:hypothetical protein